MVWQFGAVRSRLVPVLGRDMLGLAIWSGPVFAASAFWKTGRTYFIRVLTHVSTGIKDLPGHEKLCCTTELPRKPHMGPMHVRTQSATGLFRRYMWKSHEFFDLVLTSMGRDKYGTQDLSVSAAVA